MNAMDTGISTVQLSNPTSIRLNNQSSISVLGSAGNDTILAGSGGGTLSGNGGADAYVFDKTFGQVLIKNSSSDGNTFAHGELDFLSGVDYDDLWFKQSGNNLEIDLLGTSQKVTVENWYGSNADACLGAVHAGGLTLDAQVQQLVSAMAVYSSNNSGFNPTSSTVMPTDSNLQAVIAASWHG